jgi:hypothetical protein
MTVVANSTFLDAFGDHEATAEQFAALSGSTSLAVAQSVLGALYADKGVAAEVKVAPSSWEVTVGLVLNRAADPTTLMEGSWAAREAVVGQGNYDAVFATYGASQATFDTTLTLAKAGIGPGADGAFDAAKNTGYISSAADRTIWFMLNATQFESLFGTKLLEVDVKALTGDYAQLAWGGNLSLPATIAANVGGLWVENNASISNPTILDDHGVSLTAGPLGIGNSSTSNLGATPAAIGANYNFPLGSNVPTDSIALVEANVGDQAQFFAAVNAYRKALGLPPMTASQFQILSGPDHPDQPKGETVLDVSVLASAVPNSTQLLYSIGNGTPYLAYQQAIFDFVNHPSVLSSSYSFGSEPTANSPFQWAFQQLFIDAALRNMSVSIAAGDQGASGNIANGVSNVENSLGPLFALAVGGTSLVTLNSALADPTLAALNTLALKNDPETVFGLVASGLKTLPTHLADIAPDKPATVFYSLYETVWQTLDLEPSKHGLSAPFGANQTGLGGVSTSQPVPSYQSAFGLDPIGSTGLPGRSLPDVAALAGGDAAYAMLNPDYIVNPDANLFVYGVGTSAASPLWAALTAEFNGVFHDQGLPNLGFYNDLLYEAAAIAPGSFNDILLGNNVNTFYKSIADTGYFNSNNDTFMVPTGHGYAAAPGYDFTSGLGTPNGMLLARALTAIAHQQISYSSSPDFLRSDGHGGWSSGADQSLLFQTTSPDDSANVGLHLGPDAFGFFSASSDSLAWTSRLAEQSLQSDFDPALALLFDKQAQGAVLQYHLSPGETLAVSIGSTTAQATQASLSNPFGFSDFFSGADAVRVARPVAVAETVDGANDQMAVVRMRQNGEDKLAITFYRVDDLAGTINGLHPGDAGYQAALQSHAYTTSSGGTSIDGPGYGNFAQAALLHVNAGDLVAMQLDNKTSGTSYSGFAPANETVDGQHVSHLWNYGVNTWGWEDTKGGGDHDFNDLVVGLDFTSASGHGWLV